MTGWVFMLNHPGYERVIHYLDFKCGQVGSVRRGQIYLVYCADNSRYFMSTDGETLNFEGEKQKYENQRR